MILENLIRGYNKVQREQYIETLISVWAMCQKPSKKLIWWQKSA